MTTLLSGDGGGNLPQSPAAPQWGLYQNGVPLVQADCVVSLEFIKEIPISDYPVIPNNFETYNKVLTPFDARLRYSAGGSTTNRQALLNSVQNVASDATTYSLVMPEYTWPACTINHFGFLRRAEGGLGNLILDVYVKEVRQTVVQAFTNTQNPGSASPVGGGNAQPQTPTQSEDVAVTGNYQNFGNGQTSFNGGSGW